MVFLSHSLILLASFLFSYAWQSSPGLQENTSMAIGACILLYLILSFGKKTQAPAKGAFTKDAFAMFALSSLTLLLLQTTGGFDSPLFFLLYFLLFLVSFFLEPTAVFTLSVLCVLLFLQSASGLEEVEGWLKVLSVPALSPVAYFFGKVMQERMREDKKAAILEQKTEDAAGRIVADVNAVAGDVHTNLTDTQLTKLADIVKETEEMREEIKDQK